MYKKDFPIFENNPDLVYLDSAATTQKPKSVIDAVSEYLSNENSNIHRGAYDLAEKSEDLYHSSKQSYAKLIGATAEEIIYTHNATYAFNLLVQSLTASKKLQKGDQVLLGIREHHANIVARQIAADQIGFEIKFVSLTQDYDIDPIDFEKKYTDQVKLVSFGAISNVTGTILPLCEIQKKLRPETLFVIDGSQLVGKRSVDVQELQCDVFIATAHKMMALTGLGMIYMRKPLIKELQPTFGGGGVIEDVTTSGHSYTFGAEKREPGTPHVVGAVSLLHAIKYIENIGIDQIQKHDQELLKYTLTKFLERKEKLTLYGKNTTNDRVGIFSFSINKESNNIKIAEYMANQNIAIRCGGHCTHPLRHAMGQNGACRMSLYIYNTQEDIDKLFHQIDTLI